MNWLDIVVIAIVALFAIVGLFKGFFNGLISICSIFVSLIISVSTANWFANLIRQIVDIDGWIDMFLKDTLGVGDSLVVFGASYPREKVAAFLTVLLAGIILFIFIRCLVKLLKNLFESLTKNSKTINGLNKILGLVLGAVKGGLLVVIALAVCSILTSLSLPGISQNIANAIADTKVTSFAYEHVNKAMVDKINGKSFEEIISGLFDEEKAKEQDSATTLDVIYPEDIGYYTFVLNQEINYSEITVFYKAGESATPEKVSLTKENFSPNIDVSEVTDEATSTITVYGKTKEFKYKIIEA